MDYKILEYQKRFDANFNRIWDELYPTVPPYTLSARLYVEDLARQATEDRQPLISRCETVINNPLVTLRMYKETKSGW